MIVVLWPNKPDARFVEQDYEGAQSADPLAMEENTRGPLRCARCLQMRQPDSPRAIYRVMRG